MKFEQVVIHCVVPAAGIGKRMQADIPKQYLMINDKTVLQHTVNALKNMPFIRDITIAIHPHDPYFDALMLVDQRVSAIKGGAERVDSVLAGLKAINGPADAWVLVHDAARPNIDQADVINLISQCLAANCGGILAVPVRDTMKRGQKTIEKTESREHLWHALTPQFFPLTQLISALEAGLAQGLTITDESSAIEAQGHPVLLVAGRSDNIKITQPEDLVLAGFYLRQ